MILRARWVIPVDRPPIKNGAVRIQGSCVAEVGSARDISGKPNVDFVDTAILPGFVNAHTHLELTHLHDRVPPSRDFTGWLRRLREATHGFSESDETLGQSALEGMRLSLEAGVTTVGDISSRPRVTRSLLNHGPMRVVSFGEVIAMGRIRKHLQSRIESALDETHVTEHLSIGVSPHAPYTVETEGFDACSEHADRGNLPVCVHACETRAERRYTEKGDGPFRDYLKDLGVWDDGAGCPELSPIAWLKQCNVLGPRTLLAHANYLESSDIDLLVRSGTHVVYCPRTHAAFEHEPHPYNQLLRKGVNVCVGTDSLASNPSLSVLEELRYVRANDGEISSQTLLEMGNLNPAGAMGLSQCCGTISVGKRADLAIVPLDHAGPIDPVENVLSSTQQVMAVYANGRLPARTR